MNMAIGIALFVAIGASGYYLIAQGQRMGEQRPRGREPCFGTVGRG